MKKLIILFAAALAAGLVSCEKFLEEESYGSTTDLFDEEKDRKSTRLNSSH